MKKWGDWVEFTNYDRFYMAKKLKKYDGRKRIFYTGLCEMVMDRIFGCVPYVREDQVMKLFECDVRRNITKYVNNNEKIQEMIRASERKADISNYEPGLFVGFYLAKHMKTIIDETLDHWLNIDKASAE